MVVCVVVSVVPEIEQGVTRAPDALITLCRVCVDFENARARLERCRRRSNGVGGIERCETLSIAVGSRGRPGRACRGVRCRSHSCLLRIRDARNAVRRSLQIPIAVGGIQRCRTLSKRIQNSTWMRRRFWPWGYAALGGLSSARASPARAYAGAVCERIGYPGSFCPDLQPGARQEVGGDRCSSASFVIRRLFPFLHEVGNRAANS